MKTDGYLVKFPAYKQFYSKLGGKNIMDIKMDIKNIKFCSNCGGEVDECDKVCPRCKSIIVDNTSQIVFNTKECSGWLIEGKYKVIEELGRGGMGIVFLGKDIYLDRKVAIKFLLPEYENKPKVVRRFQREAQAMAKLTHPNVAQIYSFGVFGNHSYFVMEYIEGTSLEDKLEVLERKREYLPIIEACDILIDISKGLNAIHKEEIVHRDIKPGNIAIDVLKNRSVIMDFGLGLIKSQAPGKQSEIVAGTPAYMAPEMINGKELSLSEGIRSDIYSFGIMAFETLTGNLPFLSSNYLEVFQYHLHKEPPYPSSIRPGIPQSLDLVIHKCIQKDPNDRYANCDQILQDLMSIRMMELVDIQYTNNKNIKVEDQKKKNNKTNRDSFPSPMKIKVMIADLDHEFRESLYKFLKSVAPYCRINSASSGEMVLDKLKNDKIDILISSMELEDMSGLELIGLARVEGLLNNIFTIVTAQKGSLKDKEMLKRLGIKEFLVKPLDFDQISEIINKEFSIRKCIS